MEALKAGIEKTKEAVDAKKAEQQFEKAQDPNVKPSKRVDAQFEANKATAQAADHHVKAEIHRKKHVVD